MKTSTRKAVREISGRGKNGTNFWTTIIQENYPGYSGNGLSPNLKYNLLFCFVSRGRGLLGRGGFDWELSTGTFRVGPLRVGSFRMGSFSFGKGTFRMGTFRMRIFRMRIFRMRHFRKRGVGGG